MPEDGYLYVYVSNETDKNVEFDNLQISHTSNFLIETNDYYPYGLLFANTSALDVTPQKYKYNGKELQSDLRYNVLDYGARHYDPVIGRWLQVDPLAEQYIRWSPYNYCVDNPVRFIDPDGRSGDIKFESGHSAQMVGSKGVDKKEYNKAFDNIVVPAATCFATGLIATTVLAELYAGYKLVSENKPSGFGDLTKGEVKKIQKEVDRAERPLEVVGSAAKGERRNINSNLPIGKGEGTRSDIDYVSRVNNIPRFEPKNLPSIDPKTNIVPGEGNPYIGPFIQFEPQATPINIPFKPTGQ